MSHVDGGEGESAERADEQLPRSHRGVGGRAGVAVGPRSRLHSRARVQEMKLSVATEQTERVRVLETKLQEQLALLSEGDSSALAASVAKQRSLQLEVDRLTRDLQAARSERERQRSHVEEGKAIAVALQEELTKLKLSKESELKTLKDQMTALEVEKTALAKQAALHEDDVKDFLQKQEEHKKVVEDMQKLLEEGAKREEALQQKMEEKQKLYSALEETVQVFQRDQEELEKTVKEKESVIAASRAYQATLEQKQKEMEKATQDCQKQLAVVSARRTHS